LASCLDGNEKLPYYRTTLSRNVRHNLNKHLKSLMDLDLLTIARRGNLGGRITNSYNSTIERLENYIILLEKTSRLDDFTEFEKEQNRIFTIIGSVSLLEHYMNDTMFDILVSFPKKFGQKKFEIDELREEGSLLALFEKKATQTILDLAYGRFDKYVTRFSKILDIENELNELKIANINEIKNTRDVYTHNNGLVNSIYFHKVGSNSRVNREGEKLPLDEKYVKDSLLSIIEFLKEIFSKIPANYKNSSYRRVFKTMWEKTCLNNRVPFDRAWEVIDEESFYIKDRDTDYGFSSSEVQIYYMFKDIYSNQNLTDFGFLFKRWHPKSNEHQIASSWLNSPFYL
jgi:hypothetical protein